MTEFQEVVLLRDLTSDGGLEIPAGTRGHVLEALGPEEWLLELAIPDQRLEGDVRFDTCLAKRGDFLSLYSAHVAESTDADYLPSPISFPAPIITNHAATLTGGAAVEVISGGPD